MYKYYITASLLLFGSITTISAQSLALEKKISKIIDHHHILNSKYVFASQLKSIGVAQDSISTHLVKYKENDNVEAKRSYNFLEQLSKLTLRTSEKLISVSPTQSPDSIYNDYFHSLGLLSEIAPDISSKKLINNIFKIKTSQKKSVLVKFGKWYQGIQKSKIESNKAKGSIKISQDFNKASETEQSNTSFAIKFSKGAYPWKFNTDISVRFDRTNNTFNQHISSILAQGTRWIKNWDNASITNASTFESYNNSYLRLDQRLELGNRIDLNLFTRQTKKGKKIELKHLSFKLDSVTKDSIKLCSKTTCDSYKLPLAMTKMELDSINKLDTLLRRINKEEHSKIKLSLGVGVLGEQEKITNTEKLSDDFGVELDTVLIFNPTHQFKAVGRAALSWNVSDMIKIETASSFILPVLKGHREELLFNNEVIESYWDLRINLDFKITATVSDKASIGLNVTQRIDRGAPKNAFISSNFNNSARYIYESPQSHLFSEISFGYSF